MEMYAGKTLLLLLLTSGAVLGQEFKDVPYEIFPPEGGNTEIACKFDVTPAVFASDGYTLTWYKLQDFGNPEKEIALSSGQTSGGNLYADDLPQSIKNVISFKFDATVTAGPVNFKIELKNVRKEDSGRYICRAEKNGAKVGDAVTGICITFGEPTIDDVLIYGAADGSKVGNDEPEWKQQNILKLSTKTKAFLACVTVGTYPFPALTMTLENGDKITEKLSDRTNTIILEGDTPGDQIMKIKRVYSTKSFDVAADDHETELKCVGEIIDPNSNELLISRQARSTIYLEEENPTTCSGSATPIAYASVWIVSVLVVLAMQ